MDDGLNLKTEVSLLRDLAWEIADKPDSKLGVIMWAIVAGTSQDEHDFKKFLKIAYANPDHPLLAEAMMVLLRLLIDSGNFDEARKMAADIHRMEHEALHALAMLKIAKYTKDEEDRALATECLQDVLEAHINGAKVGKL